MTRYHGVVAPASTDWTLADINLTFSLVMGGFAFGALISRKLDVLGPRVNRIHDIKTFPFLLR